MTIPGRNANPGDYRYGFQNQETDPEMLGGAVAFKYRVHDPRIGRFLSVDPLVPEYPWNSPYAFSENRVIDGVELEGLEVQLVNGQSGPYKTDHPDAVDNQTLTTHNITITLGNNSNNTSKVLNENQSNGQMPYGTAVSDGSMTMEYESSNTIPAVGPQTASSEIFRVTLKVPYVSSIWTQTNVKYKIYVTEVNSLENLGQAQFRYVKSAEESGGFKYVNILFSGVSNGLNVGLVMNMWQLNYAKNISTFQMFSKNPHLLYGKSPQQLQKILGTDWKMGKYGNTGDGWKLINEKHPNQMIFYNSNGTHGGRYWGISGFKKSGSGRIKVVSKDYKSALEDPAEIIFTGKD